MSTFLVRKLRVWAYADPAYNILLTRNFSIMAYAAGSREKPVPVVQAIDCYEVCDSESSMGLHLECSCRMVVCKVSADG